ncbi:type IV toxin-antitoxin system AbiEi family antitoxin domain-containing protein [Streptomonospora sp. PA3]|uniref:type IV toxin-antitoxin system AbiEi family antitoxin domain-containing protein n=1 Tax=Streptomonospora sp. PA3 TaxID=2607326 RepID=UPI0012DE6E1B|nr:type IV toxin-antitoxin system AbiEi family antitoxin domain-containing protein [Streptomonospora sp. PA3]MUL39788.1 type IV toxin-antitoxin system AbiEi family antitoxin domain-containing protein [Streptomonospora sp. PA3]
MIFRKALPCQGDDAVALFAAAQFGLISRAQALRSGLSADDIAERLRSGVWVRTLHWGVFRVLGYGTLASSLKRAVVAAQLTLAPGAFACRDTAARLWRLDGLPPWDGRTVDMGVRWRPGPVVGTRAVSPTVRVHSLRVSEGDIVRRAPIRLTCVGRTLRDLSVCSGTGTRRRLYGSAVGRGLVVAGGTKGLPHRKRAVCRDRWLPQAHDSQAACKPRGTNGVGNQPSRNSSDGRGEGQEKPP